MGVTPIYNIPFAEPTDLVRDWPALSEDVALAIEQALEDIPVREKRIAAFTGSGTWTVPAGVTYAIAHMRGGGGGVGASDTGGAGGSSSVAFASGTVTANGGTRLPHQSGSIGTTDPGQANSGNSATFASSATAGSTSNGNSAVGAFITAGAEVTPAASISVTVGAGGAAGTTGAAGGSGYVYIEYYEEV